MKLFQYVAVATLFAALVFEITHAARRRRLSAMGLVRSLTWVAAAVTIRFPELVQAAALWSGIHRGTDLIIYIFILIFLFTSFYLYARYRSVQRQLTELIRCHAIEHAQRGRPGTRDDIVKEGVAYDGATLLARDERRLA